MIFFGNNEDYKEIPLYYWTQPSNNGNYGGVYFGFDNLSAQGGINEKGLVFDYLALPGQLLNSHSELPGRGAIMTRIQQNCATVEEAIEEAIQYDWGGELTYQIHLADIKGDAVVISAGKDGELAFTFKEDNSDFLLSTNFNLANHENTFEGAYPCWRYIRAKKILEGFGKTQEINSNKITYVLDATHIESGLGNTLYSNVYDIKEGKIYLYYWHQFNEVVVLDIKEQIANETPATLIKSLFTKDLVDKATIEYDHYKKQGIK